MSDRIEYDPQAIREVGEEVCPDIANFYDDIASKTAAAGQVRDSAFGAHALGDKWNEMFTLFYGIVFETGSNVRAMGPTLIRIAEDQEILEGELVNAFGQIESEIDANGHAPSTSVNYGAAPELPPAPALLDDNPYEAELGGPAAAF
ncbi:hypothetical protein LO763_10485 [Glycomyces sp. A-F 0318]|uniref:hypothetical protein n=1 Tax=Glycomyces amatae TaxID=2881355 RepID=UPI001E5BB34F|nr:hypothetical protein [Glycomyces amatae]MCD0444050.1 hypothetical protein [Glycomyces amatae]